MVNPQTEAGIKTPEGNNSEPSFQVAPGSKQRWLKQFFARLDGEKKVLALVFILTLPLVNTHIRGDGNEYYAYVRSLVIDGDLKFENEYRQADPAFYSAAFDEQDNPRRSINHDGTLGMMPNGYMQNFGTLGPSILWMPAFLIAHGMTLILHQFGVPLAPDGYSSLYRWLCALSTALLAFIGLMLAYGIAARLTNKKLAMIATLALWFASPLPVYMYFLPFHNPAMASFTVALFIWYWLHSGPQRTIKQWAIWGLIGGLMVEVYYITAIFLLIAFLEWLLREIGFQLEGTNLWRKFGTALIRGTVFALFVLAALVPHFVVRWIINGSPLKTGYGESFFWSDPRLLQLAFSAEHGLFSWTPIILFAFLGMILFWRLRRWESSLLLITFAFYFYTVASYQDWHGISSFGSRFFVSFTLVFIIGLAFLMQTTLIFLSRFVNKANGHQTQSISNRPFLAICFVIFLLVIWNIGFIFQWGTNLVPNRGPVDFSEVARNQVTVVPKKMIGFVARYLQSREQVNKEVEQEDLKELPEYKQRR